MIDGLPIRHPKTLHIPRIGRSIAAPLFFASLLPFVPRYRGHVDVVLGSWAHPDGCAAIALAEILGVPAAVKLHGNDMNVQSYLPATERMLRWMLPRAKAVVAVSSALKRRAVELGVDDARVKLIMNGVDGSAFFPQDRRDARLALGLPEGGHIAVCIGNLVEAKGIFDLAQAFSSIAATQEHAHLYFVGDGVEKQRLIERSGDRVEVVGSKPFQEIPQWLAAADVLVLPSWNEGTPNVILEALACGRRVVATDVGGIPDLLHSEALGRMVPAKAPDALAQALSEELLRTYDADVVAQQGAHGTWQDSAQKLHETLHSTLGE